MRLVLDAPVAVRVVMRPDGAGAGAFVDPLERANLFISPALKPKEVANAFVKLDAGR